MYHIKRQAKPCGPWETVRNVKELTDLHPVDLEDLLKDVRADACRVYNGAKWVGILALRKLLKR